MSKFLIISEEQKKMLRESFESRGLPLDMQTALISQDTPLKNNPVIPGPEYLTDAVALQFNKAKEKIGEFNNIEELETEFSQLLNNIGEQEKPIRANLEVLFYKTVAKLFNAPEDCIDFTIDIVDKVDAGGVNSKPQENDEYEYSGSEEMEIVDAEVMKKNVIDALCVGAASYFTMQCIKNLDAPNLVPDELKEMWLRLLYLNRVILCLKTNLQIEDEDPRVLGIALYELGDMEKKNFLDVKAVNFPILVFETIRGFMELFASHGLPKNKNIRDIVVKKTEYLETEPWYLRYGTKMWGDFMKMTSDESVCVPEVFMKISMLPVDKFNTLISKIFSGDEEARRIVKPLVQRLERNTFNQRMDTMRSNKTIIDEYLGADEI